MSMNSEEVLFCRHQFPPITMTRLRPHFRSDLKRPWRRAWPLFLVLFGGCTLDRAQVEKDLMAGKSQELRPESVSERYLVGSPDVLEVKVVDRNDVSGLKLVGLDGRIDLGEHGRPRVEGKPVGIIATMIAGDLGVPTQQVRVRVAEYKSQHLYLFGQVVGWQRSVPYRGQETVLEVLRRVGGITPGAAPDDVYVVRPHVFDDKRPEVFHVELADIVVKQDQRTNLRLQSGDQIYVGETRQYRIEKCIPPWLRPLYQTIWTTQPKADADPIPSANAPKPDFVVTDGTFLGFNSHGESIVPVVAPR
jgi:protein involved in polysaccharide export with SLBB domain